MITANQANINVTNSIYVSASENLKNLFDYINAKIEVESTNGNYSFCVNIEKLLRGVSHEEAEVFFKVLHFNGFKTIDVESHHEGNVEYKIEIGWY